MASYQRTTTWWSFACLLSLLNVARISAEVFRWGDAFRYIDFDTRTFSPFTLFSKYDFFEPPFVWASFLPELGAYGGHVYWPGKLEYTLNVVDVGFDYVDVKLGFAEVYLPNCNNSARLLRVSVNNKSVAPVDIFSLAGCRQPHDIVFKQVSASSPIKVIIEGIVENPMLANIVVRESTLASPTNDTDISGPPREGSMSRAFGAYNKVLFITARSNGRANRIRRTAVFQDKNSLIEGTVRPHILIGHRHGRNFTYRIRGKGTYEIQLSFAEINPIYCDGMIERVFSVFLNGRVELRNLNVFKEKGCRRALIHTARVKFSRNLLITFIGISGNAMVSHIIVRRVETSCVPESTADAKTSDHLAHSVPGEYPPIRSADSPKAFVDEDDDGFESVLINGDGSHTHFFDTENNIVGRVTSYEWTNPDTTEFISDKVSFPMRFMLGTTRLSLHVQDNICSSHTAETSVTVTGSVTTGSYCYFYAGQTSLPNGGGPDQEIKATFAKAYPDTSWNFADLPFGASDFAARCELFVSVDSSASEIRGFISAKGNANVSLLRGTEVLVESKRLSSFSAPLIASISSFEVLYVHTASKIPPTLTLRINPRLRPSYTYDRSTIFPVIKSISPRSSSLSGGIIASVEVLGASLSANDVKIGNDTVPLLRRNRETRKLFFEVPSSRTEGKVLISVKWVNGFVSNSLSFGYFDGPPRDPIAFTEHVMVSNGRDVRSALASSIRIGYDGNIYLGTLSARVLRLTYNPDSLVVTNKCESEPLQDSNFTFEGNVAPRSILGMVLHPRDRIPQPYVSVQTLFWRIRSRIDPSNPAAWRNGEIVRLVPGTAMDNDKICLVYDRKIVTGLPVSNHDHGVNGLEFTQSGDLIISIGGNTNAGLPGEGLGQLFETPLSGSIILAKLSRGSAFDGNIRYSNDTHPHKARVISGDIEILATGVRNGFFPSLHSSGRLYMTDNGPNVGFGNVASMCDEIDANITFPTADLVDFPGKVKMGDANHSYSVGRPDKLLNVKLDGEPRFYGHPNPNREDCFYVDPFTNRGPNNEPPPRNYEPPLGTIASSVNAIVEYHAGNVFGGALQGKLVLSTFQNRPTYYLPPITKPNEAVPEMISPRGGLSLAVDAWGQMIVPRLSQNNILVFRPKVPSLELREDVSITAVTPFRHTMHGNTVATIGGYNYGPGAASVQIGSSPCEVLTQSMTTITCVTPQAGKPGILESVRVTIEGKGSATLRNGLWYMEV